MYGLEQMMNFNLKFGNTLCFYLYIIVYCLFCNLNLGVIFVFISFLFVVKIQNTIHSLKNYVIYLRILSHQLVN